MLTKKTFDDYTIIDQLTLPCRLKYIRRLVGTSQRWYVPTDLQMQNNNDGQVIPARRCVLFSSELRFTDSTTIHRLKIPCEIRIGRTVGGYLRLRQPLHLLLADGTFAGSCPQPSLFGQPSFSFCSSASQYSRAADIPKPTDFLRLSWKKSRHKGLVRFLQTTSLRSITLKVIVLHR